MLIHRKFQREGIGLFYDHGSEVREGDIVSVGRFNNSDAGEEVLYLCEFSEGSFLFAPFCRGDINAPLIGVEEFATTWDCLPQRQELVGTRDDNPELMGW